MGSKSIVAAFTSVPSFGSSSNIVRICAVGAGGASSVGPTFWFVFSPPRRLSCPNGFHDAPGSVPNGPSAQSSSPSSTYSSSPSASSYSSSSYAAAPYRA